jgi:hypothetical protein
MSLSRCVIYAAVAAVVSGGGWVVYGQTAAAPTNDAPNPFQTIEGYFKLPEGRTWGSTSAVDICDDRFGSLSAAARTPASRNPPRGRCLP